MGFDPNEPRDGRGRWSRGGYGPGQRLKGTHKSSEGSVADRKAALAKTQVFHGDRWSKMPSTAKSKLTASAQFKTKMSGGKSIGRVPAKVQGDERMFVETKSGKTIPVFKYEESSHAVAIQTAKALDRDFRAARDKANKEAMKAALHKSSVPIVKYPPGKRPKR